MSSVVRRWAATGYIRRFGRETIAFASGVRTGFGGGELAQTRERLSQHRVLAPAREHHVGGVRVLGRTGDAVQPAFGDERRGHARRQEAAAAVDERELHAEPADVHDLPRPFELGIALRVLGVEARSPFDVDVILARSGVVGARADQHQRLVEQVLDDQARGMGRGVHQADVERALDQAAHQVVLETDLAADHDIVRALAHPTDPLRQESFPQRGAPADADTGAIALRQADVGARLLGGEHEAFGVIEEAPAGGREARARAVAREQPRAELVFQAQNAGADGRLGQVQLPGGFEEAALRRDREEGFGLVDVHERTFKSNISILHSK